MDSEKEWDEINGITEWFNGSQVAEEASLSALDIFLGSLTVIPNKIPTITENQYQVSCALFFFCSSNHFLSYISHMNQNSTSFIFSTLKNAYKCLVAKDENMWALEVLFFILGVNDNEEQCCSTVIPKILDITIKEYNRIYPALEIRPFEFFILEITTCNFCKKTVYFNQKLEKIYEIFNCEKSIQETMPGTESLSKHFFPRDLCVCEKQAWSTERLFLNIPSRFFIINIVNCQSESPFIINERLVAGENNYILDSFITRMQATNRHTTYFTDAVDWWSFCYMQQQRVDNIKSILQYDKNITFLFYRKEN